MITEKIRKITNPGWPVKVKEIIEQLNPVIRGWVNYFKIANSSKKFGKIRLYTAKKVRKFMRRRRNKSGYGYKKYPDDYLYKKLGLYRDYRLSWTKASRWAVIGKPCEGEPHARFDEGTLEIGYGWDIVTLLEETGRNREHKLRPTATAPEFYSTDWDLYIFLEKSSSL